jgi:hypothetical protein
LVVSPICIVGFASGCENLDWQFSALHIVTVWSTLEA